MLFFNGPRPEGLAMFTLSGFFLICAVVGGTVLICQFVLTLVGLGGDHSFAGGHDVSADYTGDAGHDMHVGGAQGAEGIDHDTHGHHGSSWLFGIVSFRTLVAAATFFGLAGLAAQSAELRLGPQLLVAMLAGLGAMYGVHWLVTSMGRLSEDGTQKIRHAIGQEGTVYIPIAPAKARAGKVQIRLQNRLVEYEAVTNSAQRLATGTKIRVVGIAGAALEVEPLAPSKAI
jgi:membrane protein implicated in regulation of membrane protease activity